MRKIPPIKKLREMCQPKIENFEEHFGKGFIPSLKRMRYNPHFWIQIVGRPISIYATKFFLYTPITANQITLISILVAIIGGIFLSFGKLWAFIIGSLFFYLFVFLDMVDGEVARYKKTSAGFRGEYISLFAHSFVDLSLDIGLVLGVYSLLGNNVVLLFGLIMILFGLLTNDVISNYYRTLIFYRETNHKKILSKPTKKKGSFSFLQIPYIKLIEDLVFTQISIPFWIMIATILGVLLSGILPFGLNFLALLIIFYALTRPIRFFVIFSLFFFTNKMENEYKELFGSH